MKWTPRQSPDCLAQCDIGLVILDPRHRTHNVPGKFLSYMQAGLPVLARLNCGNDLAAVIREEQVGRAYTGDSLQEFQELAQEVINQDERGQMKANARLLADRLYSPTTAVRQIVSALKGSA